MNRFNVHIALFAVGLLASPAAAGTPSEQSQIPSAFANLCASPDISVQSVLARADKDDWQREGAHLPQDFNPAENRIKDTAEGLLLLKVGSQPVPSGHWNACSISGAFQSPKMVAAVQNILGFPPAIKIGASATFFAEWSGNTWHTAASFNRADTVAAKARGSFFSITVGTEPESSFIMIIQPMDAHP